MTLLQAAPFVFLTAYLIGSIPSAVWVGRFLHGCDVREHGSGNAGATNTFRVLGRQAGLIVMAMDIIKGMAAAAMGGWLLDAGLIEYDELTRYQIALGLVAIGGHIFPVWAGFKGGKGVATLVGVMLTVQLELALACLAVFVIVLWFSRYVSLGSMVAALAFPLLMMTSAFEAGADERTIALAFSLTIVVIVTHLPNIRRLLEGNESKVPIRVRRR